MREIVKLILIYVAKPNLLHHSKRSCIYLIEKIYFRIYLEVVQTVYSLAKTYLVIFVPIFHLINFVIFKVVKRFKSV